MNSKVLAVAAVAVGSAVAYLFTVKKCDASLLQQYFSKFHDEIKLSNVDENSTLREKRDLLLKELASFLPEDVPKWSCFNQGSYAMSTGINPPDGDFDIDVGIIFECTRKHFPNPVALKQLVCDALRRGNRTVVIRRSCVSIQYMRNGDADYHVDLAIYVKRKDSLSLELAKGKSRSSEANRHWSEQDPQLLIEKIRSKFTGPDAEQFRRCIRYLKRWRNEQFRNGGAPLSIALTCAAYYWFVPRKSSWNEANYFDAEALYVLVDQIVQNFSPRLRVHLPVTPSVDLLEVMTPSQMQVFKEKLSALHDTLKTVMSMPATNVNEACHLLSKKLGKEFPVPSTQ